MLGLSGSPLRKPYSIASAPWEVTQVGHHAGARPGRGQRRARSASRARRRRARCSISTDRSDRSDCPSACRRDPLLFIAGGTGHRAAALDVDRAPVAADAASAAALIYSARSVDEFAFRAELAALEAAGRITSYFTVTREETSEWQGRRGRISEALLSEALPSPDSTCLVCGPPQLVNDTRVAADEAGCQRRHGF